MRIEIEELLTLASQTPNPLLILLDGLQDPRNVGAILRTAEAAGAQGIIIPRHRSAGITDTVRKTSTGASDWMPIAQVANLDQSIRLLKENGYWIVGLEANAKSWYTEIDARRPLALVIGSEGKGLSRLLRDRCDYTAKIPMRGKITSLNASVAAAIMMYEIVRQRMEKS